jgi:hypothetical protein
VLALRALLLMGNGAELFVTTSWVSHTCIDEERQPPIEQKRIGVYYLHGESTISSVVFHPALV